MKIQLHQTLVLVVLFAAGACAASNNTTTTVDLGTAGQFGLLAGSGVTNASAATSITGDVGSSPTPSITGLTASQVHGILYTTSSPVTSQAQSDLTIAYNEAAGEPCATDLTGTDLGGLTLVPGTYCFSSSAGLTGTLTLDAQGNANAQWVFQIGSTLTTATNSSVVLTNGAVNCNVFWQVGSSATIQTNNTFVGNILALTSITLDGGTLNGRALARNGAVTIAAQETVNASACSCSVMVSSSTAGTVTKIPLPYSDNWTEAVVATGLTSVEGLACGTNRLLYAAQSGVFGGPSQIVSMDQNGMNQTTVVEFSTFPGLAASGGPNGLSFSSTRSTLFFSTTLAQGLSNTGVWQTSTSSPAPVQSVLAFPPNGSSNGGGATAFLTTGPFAGNLLAVDEANRKVIRVTPPFNTAKTGINFIVSKLTSPVGLAVNTAGNIFVSNTDGTIQQFGTTGKWLGLFATTGFHNMNIAFFGPDLIVATQDGPVIQIAPNGTQETIGTVVGGDGVALCKE
jgi:Ice-binding-like